MKLRLIHTDFIFLILLIILSLLYNYQEIIFLGPYSNHTWRQADCLSLTLNYYKENLSLLCPEVHWIGNKGHGKTISEFPIIYYTVAQLWKVFGQKEFIFRIITILIVFTGLSSLQKLTYKLLGDKFWSITIPLFLFTSPLLIFYTNNFLPNVSAFSFAIIGSYYYYQFYNSGIRKKLIISMLIFLLAGLLKITSLIIFIAILGVVTIDTFRQILKKENSIKYLLYRISPFLIVILGIVIWYLYARYYNKHNHRNIFLQDIFPIWELSGAKRKETFNLFYQNLIPSYFNKYALLGIMGMFLIDLFVIRKNDKTLTSILVLTFIGMIFYFFLFFRAFHVHDYYLTNLLVFIPLTLIVFLTYLKNNFSNIFRSIILKIIFTVLLLGLITQGALKNRLKYDTKHYLGKTESFFINKKERNYWDYYHWAYKNNFKAFETISPYLRTLGITRYDKVLSFSDGTINHSLYLMDQKGLTKYGFGHLSDGGRVEFAIEQGCKYLIVTEQDLKKLKIKNEYLQNKVGQYQNILIFRIS